MVAVCKFKWLEDLGWCEEQSYIESKSGYNFERKFKRKIILTVQLEKIQNFFSLGVKSNGL